MIVACCYNVPLLLFNEKRATWYDLEKNVFEKYLLAIHDLGSFCLFYLPTQHDVFFIN